MKRGWSRNGRLIRAEICRGAAVTIALSPQQLRNAREWARCLGLRFDAFLEKKFGFDDVRKGEFEPLTWIETELVELDQATDAGLSFVLLQHLLFRYGDVWWGKDETNQEIECPSHRVLRQVGKQWVSRETKRVQTLFAEFIELVVVRDIATAKRVLKKVVDAAGWTSIDGD